MQITPSQIESWVSRHFEYKKRSSGKQLVINNPFDGDAGWHFWISLDRVKSKKHPELPANYWVHDFRPGHGSADGSFLKLVQKYRGFSYFEAVKDVCGNAKTAREVMQSLVVPIIEDDEPELEDELLEFPAGSKKFSDNLNKAGNIAANYLKSRCISLEQAKINYIRYTPTSVVFPYMEFGMMVYWQERAIISKDFRFPPDSVKTDYLYGFDDVEPKEFIIITEAIFDKLVIGDNCVATGGAEMAGKQFRKLKALGSQMVILAPDNDEAGLVSLRKNSYELKRQFECKLAYCVPPRHGDLNDWNAFDQEFGVGWSRKYIENNTRSLDLKSIIRPWVGDGVQTTVSMG